MSDDMLPVGEIDIEPHSIIQSDATELPYGDESFHAIVTDPPYGLAFMGKNWDQFEPKEYQEFCEDWGKECLRVLKPGGHMLAFSGTRTYHRMATGVEDAGFDIRDKIDWLYGSGFPKATDVSKEIDRKLDKEDEREVVDEREETSGMKSIDKNNEEHDFRPNRYYDDEPDTIKETVGASEQAQRWEGFKTALKPAHEPIVVARKPLEEDTVAEQIMATGTGALNIDGTRIATHGDESLDGGRWSGVVSEGSNDGYKREWMEDEEKLEKANEEMGERVKKAEEQGRYPANIILDIEAAQMLDREVGELGVSQGGGDGNATEIYGADVSDNRGEHDGSVGKGDSGGPSRYFYTSKASKSERTMNERIDNPHPTVKPVDLMAYLVRFVTAKGQKVCDPFLGSGTTLLGCEQENRVGYGSDMDKEYCEIATKRLGIRMGTELGSFMDY
jgi:site-specific DNA-methyltransferase (adenine-specific)